MKRVISIIATAFALALGFTMVGSAANAAPAQAAVSVHAAAPTIIGGAGGAVAAETWTAGPEKWSWDYRWDPYQRVYYCGVWAYNDYSWAEEVFQGKRDGWEREWWARC